MKRMKAAGCGAGSAGPSLPSRCSTRVASAVNSQSSMNSQQWKRPSVFDSGITSIMSSSASSTAFLNSKPPSSRSALLSSACTGRCLVGTRSASSCTAVTTTTLSSSEPTSAIKDAICFTRRSTLASEPVFSSVVMAMVPMALLGSAMRHSRSSLHFATDAGAKVAMRLSVRTAA